MAGITMEKERGQQSVSRPAYAESQRMRDRSTRWCERRRTLPTGRIGVPNESLAVF
jgi:hypothetical protein